MQSDAIQYLTTMHDGIAAVKTLPLWYGHTVDFPVVIEEINERGTGVIA